MSSPFCANCSRDCSRAGLGIGPVAQAETAKQVGTGVEVTCSQGEVLGPVAEVDSVPAVIGPVMELRGPVVGLAGVEANEELSLVVQAVTVNVSAAEATAGPAYEPANPDVSPRVLGPEDEVRWSVV